MFRMIATDLDKTLLGRDGLLSDYTVSVLRKCQANGIPVTFATARPQRTLPYLHDDFLPDYAVSNNGATVLAGGTLIPRHMIAAETLHLLLPRLLAEREVTCVSVECGDYQLTNYDGPSWGPGWNAVHSDFSILPAMDSPKLSVECKSHAVLQRILADFPTLHLHGNAGEDWWQIMHRDATKANGVRFVAERMGISLTEVVAFGDDSNDIDLLRACGRGVAVQNAAEEVLRIAGEVCLPNSRDGVARWLDEHLASLT